MSTPDPFGLEPASHELPVNAVQQVERALFDRAIGVTVSKDVLTRDGPVTLETELPSDVKAAQTFLAAHMPDVYGGQVGQSATVVVLTDPEQLRAMLTQKKAIRPAIEHNATPPGLSGRAPGAFEDSAGVATHPPTSIFSQET
jgi:hypothetical protein